MSSSFTGSSTPADYVFNISLPSGMHPPDDVQAYLYALGSPSPTSDRRDWSLGLEAGACLLRRGGTAVTGMMPLQHMTDRQALRPYSYSGGDGRLSVFPMDIRPDICAGGCGHVQAPRGLGSDRGSERRSHAGPLQLHDPGKLLFLS